jgi:heptosyltransferase III
MDFQANCTYCKPNLLMVSNITVVCSPGIGDALIFSIASFSLQQQGVAVTTVHPRLADFGRWLIPGTYVAQLPDLAHVDAILLQYDNSLRAQQIAALRAKLPVYLLYPTYHPQKHGPLDPRYDCAFDPSKNMVDNMSMALRTLFGISATKQNVLQPPAHLTHRKYPTRIVLHPTSGAVWRNWPPKKFLLLAHRLQQCGLEPFFCVAPEERYQWPSDRTPLLPSLEEYASFLYESGAFIGNNSGPGHLASCLSLPHVILGHQARHMRLWQPGWFQGTVLLPASYIPNFKGFRIREQYWGQFISVRKVLNSLKRNLDCIE